MKYALNHSWKFENCYIAYLVGLTQLVTIGFVEATNVAVVLLANDSIIDIILSFFSLLIISEFDEFFYQSMKDRHLSKLISFGCLELNGK